MLADGHVIIRKCCYNNGYHTKRFLIFRKERLTKKFTFCNVLDRVIIGHNNHQHVKRLTTDTQVVYCHNIRLEYLWSIV